MREVLPAIERWHAEGKRVALATVVDVWGSAPRRPGAKMAISSAGDIAGSVSGGCVESAVAQEAQKLLAEDGAGDEPAPHSKLLEFGVTDDEAWAVGLSCGGRIEVFVEPLETAPDETATGGSS